MLLESFLVSLNNEANSDKNVFPLLANKILSCLHSMATSYDGGSGKTATNNQHLDESVAEDDSNHWRKVAVYFD